MRVKFAVTVEVDLVAWIAEYGLLVDPNDPGGDVRRDVKAYLSTLVEDSAARRKELLEVVQVWP